jgi:hypothetical protein
VGVGEVVVEGAGGEDVVPGEVEGVATDEVQPERSANAMLTAMSAGVGAMARLLPYTLPRPKKLPIGTLPRLRIS